MKKLLFLLALSSLVSLSSLAQDYSADQHGRRQRQNEIDLNGTATPKLAKPFVQSKYELGFASGFTSGYGFSFRYWPKKVGFQLTLLPSVSNNKKNLSAGLLGLCELDAKSWCRFFVYYGGNFNWTQNPNHSDFNINADTNGKTDFVNVGSLFNFDPMTEEQKSFTIGCGPGVEFTPGRHFGINLMAGLRYYSTDYAFSKDAWGLTLTGEVAIYYRF